MLRSWFRFNRVHLAKETKSHYVLINLISLNNRNEFYFLLYFLLLILDLRANLLYRGFNYMSRLWNLILLLTFHILILLLNKIVLLLELINLLFQIANLIFVRLRLINFLFQHYSYILYNFFSSLSILTFLNKLLSQIFGLIF